LKKVLIKCWTGNCLVFYEIEFFKFFNGTIVNDFQKYICFDSSVNEASQIIKFLFGALRCLNGIE
jgi:hypothetical protein